jgi:predicted nucleotidyltransferase
MKLPEDRRQALEEILRLWGPERFVLIGATAMACQLDQPWRTTRDIDLCVAQKADKCAEDLVSLGWHQRQGAPQQWTTSVGTLVDIIPVEEEELAVGSLVWAGTDVAMSTLGLRLAFADTVPLDLVAGHAIRMASLPAIVLLKMAAYLDRPWLRETDLGDIAQIIAAAALPDSDRWSDEVIEAELAFDDVAPFLFGLRLGRTADISERGLLDVFLGHTATSRRTSARSTSSLARRSRLRRSRIRRRVSRSARRA